MKKTPVEHSVVRGFTLVELLIVLAILAAATAVILNPGELLAQVVPADLGSGTAGGRCTADTAALKGPFGDPQEDCGVQTGQSVDGSGWVDVNLTLLTTNTPFARLPLDPVNNATYFYAYHSSATDRAFELNTRLESRKHRGSMASDGGNRKKLS